MVLDEHVQINGAGRLFRQDVTSHLQTVRHAAFVAPAAVVTTHTDSWSSSPASAASSLLAIMSGEQFSTSSGTSLTAEAGARLAHWLWSEPMNVFSLCFIVTVVLGFSLFALYTCCAPSGKSQGGFGGGFGKGGYSESFGEGFGEDFGAGKGDMGMGPNPTGKGKPAGAGKKGPDAGMNAGGMVATASMGGKGKNAGGMAGTASMGGKGKNAGGMAGTASMGGKGKKGKMQPAASQAGPAPVPEPATPAAATEESATPAPAPSSSGAGRVPVEGQKVILNVLVIDGKDMPSVNTFGGCDPFVEIRIVQDDPTIKKGALNEVPITTVKTKSQTDKTEPKWNESLKLKHDKLVHDSSTFVEFILWDWNATGNMALGFQALSMVDVLAGLDFDASANSQGARDHTCNFTSLMTGSNANKAVKATVNVSFSYLEVHKFQIKAVKATHLPSVKSMGSVDPILECRIIDGDPTRIPFELTPGKECYWHDATAPQPSNPEPHWRQELEGNCVADPSHNLLLAVLDSSSLGNTPLGFAFIPMRDVLTKPMGTFHEYPNLKLKKFPGIEAAGDVSKSKVTVEVCHSLAMAKMGSSKSHK